MANGHGGQNKKSLSDVERQEAAVLFGYDMSMERIAAYFGMHKDTFTKLVKNDAELASALERARAKMGAELRQLAMGQARMGSVPMIIFLLKTREGYRETDRLELTGADGGAVKVAKELSVEEATALLAKYDRLESRILKKT